MLSACMMLTGGLKLLRQLMISFIYPHGPIQFNWSKREDRCFVPFKQVLCHISTPCSVTGQQHNLMDKDTKLIHESLRNLKEGY